MGFFSNLTRPAWEKLTDKARRAADAGDAAAAHRYFGEALEKCPDDQRGALESGRDDAARVLYAVNFGEGSSREAAGHEDRAREHFELALRYATTDEERERARERVAALVGELRARKEREREPPMPEEGLELDDDQAFDILISGMEEELSEAYMARDGEFRRAFMAMQRGELAQALAYFETLGAVERGRCLHGAGRTDEGIEQLLRAEQLKPAWIFIKLILAEMCWAAKRLELAEEVLQRAIDTDQEDADVYVAICRTAVLREMPEYGLEAAAAGLEVAPNDRRLIVLRARLSELDEKWDAAITDYEKIVNETWRYDSQEGKLYFHYDSAFLLAQLYRRLGRNLARAVELFRALIGVSDEPQLRWPLELALADCLVADDDQEAAREILDELVHVIGDDQAFGHLRIAELRGEDAEYAERLGALSEDQRAEWERIQARRVR